MEIISSNVQYLFYVLTLFNLYQFPCWFYPINVIDGTERTNGFKNNGSDNIGNQIPVCDFPDSDIFKNSTHFMSENSKIKLQKYFLGYKFDDQMSRYNGRVGINFSVLGDNVSKVVLHSSHNNITSFILDVMYPKKNKSDYVGNDDEVWDIKPILINTICYIGEQSDLLFVSFNRNLQSEAEYILDIEFNGEPSSGMNGIYRTQYQVPLSNVSNSEKQPSRSETIISTHFEPKYARIAFPCFDEPSMKAKFSIYLTHSKHLKSFSNMPVESKIENNDGTVTVFFKETPPMSTYLVAFSVNNYSAISIVSDSINEVNVLLPSHMIEKGEFALDVATKALKLFESLTLIPYVLEKLDLIGIPSFEAGAMENWGLITFRLTQMIYDNHTVSTRAKEYVAQTVIHEISHQWFGNYVTMKKWNDIWLNEGFATFMEVYATDRLFPQWDITVEERTLVMDNAIEFDELDMTHAMAVPENYTDNIETLFDAISYTKSGNVLAMLHEVVGDDRFWTVIKKYLNKYAFSSATSTDLWNILAEEINIQDINSMINSWIFNKGLPVVTLTLVNKTNEETLISLSQRRFIMSPLMEKINSEHPYKWTIPITYKVQYDSNNTVYDGILWLTETSKQFKINGSVEMMKINKDRTGFYVSQYEDDFWTKIIRQLEINKNVLSASDKVSLLSDSMRLSKNGMIEFSFPMKLLRILINDINYYIQVKCFDYLQSIGWLLNKNDNLYESFKKYMRALLHQRYQQLNTTDSTMNLTDRHRIILLNTVSLMCTEYNCSDVVSYLLRLYNEWKFDPESISAILRAAAIYGSPEDIISLEEHYRSVEDPHLKRRFLVALTQVRNETLLKKYLNATIFDNFVQLQDFGSFFYLISSNKCGTNITWAYVKNYWSKIKEKLVDSKVTLSSLMPSVSSRFKNKSMIKEIDEFYLANRDSIFAKDYNLAIENIRMNVDWSTRVIQSISKDGIFHI